MRDLLRTTSYLTTVVLLLCWQPCAFSKESTFDKAVRGEVGALLKVLETQSPDQLDQRLRKRAPIQSPACKRQNTQLTGTGEKFNGLFDYAIDNTGMLHAVFSAGDAHGFQHLYYRVGKNNLWSKATKIYAQSSLRETLALTKILVAKDQTVFVVAVVTNSAKRDSPQKLIVAERDPKKGWKRPLSKRALIPNPTALSGAIAKGKLHVAWPMDRQDGIGFIHAQIRGKKLKLKKNKQPKPFLGSLFTAGNNLYLQSGDKFSRFLKGKWRKRLTLSDTSNMLIHPELSPALAASPLNPGAALASAMSTTVYTGAILNKLRAKWTMAFPNIPPSQRQSVSYGWSSIKEPVALIARGPHIYIARPGNPSALGSPLHFGPINTRAFGTKLHLAGNQLQAMWAEVSGQKGIKIFHCSANLKSALWSPLNKAIWQATAGRGLTASDRILLAEYLTLVGQRDWQQSQPDQALTNFLKALQAVTLPAEAQHANAMVQRLAATRPQMFLKTLINYGRRYPSSLKLKRPGFPGAMLSNYVHFFAIKPGEVYLPPEPGQYDDIAATTMQSLIKQYPDLYRGKICVALENRDPGKGFFAKLNLKNVAPLSNCPQAKQGAANLVTFRWFRWIGKNRVKASANVFIQGTNYNQTTVLQQNGSNWNALTSQRNAQSH